MQISTQAAFQWYQMADQLGTPDGNITREETAKAVLATIQQYNVAVSVNDTFAVQQLQQQLQFAGTLLMGGTQNQGLIPDFDGNTAVSLNEIVRLDADKNGSITAQDFSAVFGATALNAAGNQFSLDQLRTLATPLATGQVSTFNPRLPLSLTMPMPVPGLIPPPGLIPAPTQLGPQQAFMLLTMLSMLSMFGQQPNTGGTTPTTPPNTGTTPTTPPNTGTTPTTPPNTGTTPTTQPRNGGGIPPELLLPILSYILTNSFGLTPTTGSTTATPSMDTNAHYIMSQLQNTATGTSANTTSSLLSNQITSQASSEYLG